MLAGARVRVGERVRIRLEPDLEEREILVAPELARELKSDRQLKKWFDALSPSMRREACKWINEPKSAESRAKRAVRMAERLFQAMEGETDPPPVLKAAFERQPLARAAWYALTPAQRRNHLLGIFYYETPEARGRRAAKAVEAALEAGQKAKKNGNRNEPAARAAPK
jgi:uncharacterized protein YdeI (YjbR/CyaY-like superfamily)